MRRTASVAVPLLAVLALIVAGCSEGNTTATPETVVGSVPTETTTGGGDVPALSLTGDATKGKSIFTSAGCVACHTLAAAGSSGTVGPGISTMRSCPTSSR